MDGGGFDSRDTGGAYPGASYSEYPGGAYGSPGAGAAFNPVEFIKKPQVILRILSWVFSVIVFGCISSSAWDGGQCYYGTFPPGDPAACGYGTFVGVLAFLLMLGFLALDAMFENISNALHRKYIVIADIGASGVLSFLWFVCFCYLADSWRRSTPPETSHGPHYWRGSSPMEAAIAFSFFSIATSVALTVLAVLRYRQGSPTHLSPNYNSDPFGGFDTAESAQPR